MQNLPSGEYWMYLRKSRADLEAEARGEGETLKKHERMLYKLAKDLGILITEEPFREIASGESIYHRPEMLRMLDLMEERRPKGILVMDIDRLGRGDMQEQGLILGTFQRLNILIITPRKIYDLNNEFDEEYSEFEAFMARKELKIITRRLQRGRVLSVEAGNYIATRPPYGYQVIKDGRNRYLVPHPEQAPVVKLIFELYTHDDPEKRMGSNKIAIKLNELGYTSYTGKKWTSSSVLTIIKNAVYIGRIQWKKKEVKKSKITGKKKDVRTRPVQEWIDVQGKHEPLIDEVTFQKAQEILKQKYHVPYQQLNGITNPLAGVIKCAKCGASMILRPYTKQAPHLMCYNRFCDNKSSQIAYVEEKLLQALEKWMDTYVIEYGQRKRKVSNMVEVKQNAVNLLKREMDELEAQKERLHDLLERGIYDEETYLDRSKKLAERISSTKERIERAEQELKEEQHKEQAQKDVIPKLKNVIKLYWKSKYPAKKNALLKSVLLHATYKKEKWQRKDQFELVLVPKFK